MNKLEKQKIFKQYIGGLCDEVRELASQNIEVEVLNYSHREYYTDIDELEFKELLNNFFRRMEDLNLITLDEDLKSDVSINDLMKIVNQDNLFEYFEEVESWVTGDSDDRYVWKEIVCKPRNIDNNKHYKFTLQSSNDVNLDLVYNGEVEKKEVIKWEWV